VYYYIIYFSLQINIDFCRESNIRIMSEETGKFVPDEHQTSSIEPQREEFEEREELVIRGNESRFAGTPGT
jgi:hypothetical protein